MTSMEIEMVWDLLPEEFPYEDKGCELFSSCLNCPFPNCIREELWGKERFLKRERDQRMLELKQECKSIEEIARIFDVSVSDAAISAKHTHPLLSGCLGTRRPLGSSLSNALE